MNLKASGSPNSRRIVRDDGSLAGMVEKLMNNNWMIFVGDQRLDGQEFKYPKKALDWARENMK